MAAVRIFRGLGMFRIITDPEEAVEFGRAGLLWWVSKED